MENEDNAHMEVPEHPTADFILDHANDPEFWVYAKGHYADLLEGIAL